MNMLWKFQILAGLVLLYTVVVGVVAKLHWSFWPVWKGRGYNSPFCGVCNERIFKKPTKDLSSSYAVAIFWPVTLPVMLGLLLARKIHVFSPESKD